MREDVTSKSLAGPSELVMVMPIREGFVDCLDTRTYKSRLKAVAGVFSDLRVASREARLIQPFSDVVDRIRTILAVHIAIVEPDKLLLSVAFDKAWEPYIRLVWSKLGSLLDPILVNCEGYSGVHSSDQGYAQFAKWIRDHQVNTDTYYVRGAHSFDDLLYLDQLEALFRTRPASREREYDTTSHRFRTPGEIARAQRPDATDPAFGDYIKMGIKAITAFHSLAALYPKTSEDHSFLIRAAKDVLSEFEPASPLWPDRQFGLIKQLFKTELAWFNQAVKRADVPADVRAALQPKAIQGGIVKAYSANIGCMLLCSVEDGGRARRLLRGLLDRITTAERKSEDGVYTNIAFTALGLRRLGVSRAELESFPKEFRDGMAARAGLLGDVHVNHPDHWALPERNWPVGASGPRVNLDTIDLVIQLRTLVEDASAYHEFNCSHPLYPEVESLADVAGGALRILSVEAGYRRADGKEHFGFVDGISQPKVALSAKSRPDRDTVMRGELFMGYANGRGDAGGELPTLLDAGTFLVIRKLAQDVPAFDKMVVEQADANSLEPERLRAKLMGRSSNGVPLTEPPSSTPTNDFDFAADDGSCCPLQSHVRRTNPRSGVLEPDEPVPRIRRSGMLYGPPADDGRDIGAKRGLLFHAYNASIAEQFEVIQRWVSGGNSTGQYSGQDDPLLGVPKPGRQRHIKLPLDRKSHAVASVALGAEPFVTLEWGAYLFVPSMLALAEIAGARPAAESGLVERGAVLIDRMRRLEASRPQAARDEWKRTLEERDSLDDEDHHAVWAAIRELHGGVLRTPFGILVGGAEFVDEVLRDHQRFSVDGYQERLRDCIGANYLGRNPPSHDREAAAPNEVLAEVSEREGFQAAYAITKKTLSGLETIAGDIDIPLFTFADVVLAFIAQHWFGIPDGDAIADPANPKSDPFVHGGGQPARGDEDTAHCPYHFTSPSRYVFQPRPSPDVRQIAAREGRILRRQVTAYLAATEEEQMQPLTRALMNAVHSDRMSKRTSVLMGALLGAMPTIHGNLISVLRSWIRDKSLWRIQDKYLAATGALHDKALSAVLPALVATMAANPVPGMVHRRARVGGSLGGVWIERDALVVAGLVSATADGGFRSVDPVFGGDYYSLDKPAHACPGRKMAMGTLLGMICAFLELSGTLRETPSSLALTLQR